MRNLQFVWNHRFNILICRTRLIFRKEKKHYNDNKLVFQSYYLYLNMTHKHQICCDLNQSKQNSDRRSLLSNCLDPFFPLPWKKNMLRVVILLQFCVCFLIFLLPCGKNFVLQVTRDRYGDTFNNFNVLCGENIELGRSGCQERHAVCMKDCCTCRCKYSFSTFRVSGTKTKSVCQNNSFTRFGKYDR